MSSQKTHTKPPPTEVAVAPAKEAPAELRGCWRIETMEVWRREAIDTLGPAFIFFEGRGGTFRFICVEGGLDCEFDSENGKLQVQWSWSGQDDRDPATGRGWALLVDDNTIQGRFFIHNGDSSDFTASRSVKDLRDPMPAMPRRRGRRR